MFSRKSKIVRLLLPFGIVTFLAISFLSLSYSGMTMGMGDDMSMSHCPFMSEMGICEMTLSEHIGIWQSLFAHILTPENVLLLLVLLVAVLLPYWTTLFSPPKDILIQIRRIANDTRVHTPPFLQELFSQGILNPKLF